MTLYIMTSRLSMRLWSRVRQLRFPTYNLDNNIIHCEDHVKLLGVTIDFKLSYDLHISNVCKKASRQLNMLKRIGRNVCRLGKLNLYYSFIMSNFNYCPLVWHFCG